MLSERLQVLMTRTQRRRLEEEARRRGTSVGAVIREAVDARARRAPLAERMRAMEEIRAMRGRHVPVETLERIVEEERESLLAGLTRRSGRR